MFHNIMSIIINQNGPGLKYDSYKKRLSNAIGSFCKQYTLDPQLPYVKSNLWAEKKNLVNGFLHNVKQTISLIKTSVDFYL
jgi:hypothetical protein